jgi:hypothetical protein
MVHQTSTIPALAAEAVRAIDLSLLPCRTAGALSISILPTSLELLRKVENELAAIEKLRDEATVRHRVAALNVEIAKVNATVMEGPPMRLSTLDVDKIVARWRRT